RLPRLHHDRGAGAAAAAVRSTDGGGAGRGVPLGAGLGLAMGTGRRLRRGPVADGHPDLRGAVPLPAPARDPAGGATFAARAGSAEDAGRGRLELRDRRQRAALKGSLIGTNAMPFFSTRGPAAAKPKRS